MIREYRGKRLDNGKWIYGSLVRFDESTAFIMPEFPRASTQSYADIFFSTAIAVDINTVGQSIGLASKDEKEIFDGDYLKNINNGIIRRVYWNPHCFAFHLTTKQNEGGKVPYWSISHPKWNYEIVGNRFDNPELSKECVND